VHRVPQASLAPRACLGRASHSLSASKSSRTVRARSPGRGAPLCGDARTPACRGGRSPRIRSSRCSAHRDLQHAPASGERATHSARAGAREPFGLALPVAARRYVVMRVRQRAAVVDPRVSGLHAVLDTTVNCAAPGRGASNASAGSSRGPSEMTLSRRQARWRVGRGQVRWPTFADPLSG